jgi:hypothetical protein
MSFSKANVDRILTLLNDEDISKLKKEDYDIFQYQGFDPYRLVEALIEVKDKKSINDGDFMKDIQQMVAIGLIKGNVNGHNITKLSPDGKKGIEDIMKKYGILMGSGKSQPAGTITFPRIMAAFADIAVRMVPIVGGKEFRGGPFRSFLLPEPMMVQVFPAVIPLDLDKKVKVFLLTACLCYSVDQTVTIKRLDKFDVKVLAAEQFKYVNLGHTSTLPRPAVRKQCFNQMGLPAKYSMIKTVVDLYKEQVDDQIDIPSENEYKQALAII